jgi:hypothetical protein
MGTEKRLEVIMEDVGHWFRHNSHGLYLKHIQAEVQYVAGWLLYSSSNMDLSRLQRDIESRVGFPVHARWQMINTGHNWDLKEADKVRAVHLRVDSDLQAEALERLGEIYSSTSTNYPLGYTMRMIPPIDRLMNPQHKDAFEELRIRQRNFMANMVTVQSWEVAALFSASTVLSQTLHDLIMMMPSPNFPALQLFHCADKNSAKAPCTFMVHPSDETHARAMVAGLIPYLRFQFRRKLFPDSEHFTKEENEFMAKHLYRFFTPDAVKRSMRCDWSAKDGGVTSREAESALNALNDYDHFKFAAAAKVVVETDKVGEEAMLPPAQYQPGESDSVPTFREPGPLVRRTSATSSQSTNVTGCIDNLNS